MANFFFKRSGSKYFRFVLQLINFATVVDKHPQTSCKITAMAVFQ